MSTTAPVLQSLAAALASGDVRVVDLTQPLHEKTPVLKLPEPFANTPGLTRHEISNYDDRGPAWAWSWLEIGEHVGTHFDAPIHWITGKDGDDVASVAATRLVGPAVVIDKSGEAAECARWLAQESPIVGIGVETVGTDAGGAAAFEPPFPVHSYFLGAGKYGLTQLANLAELPSTGALIIVAPLKLVDGTGTPTRVFA